MHAKDESIFSPPPLFLFFKYIFKNILKFNFGIYLVFNSLRLGGYYSLPSHGILGKFFFLYTSLFANVSYL